MFSEYFFIYSFKKQKKKLTFTKKKHFIQPQLIWDYPLNLSILMRGGKETNKDFLSSGERKENSSALSHFVYMANVRCSVWNILISSMRN